MKYFSMFSGIGGFELGIEKTYNNKQTSTIKQNGKRGDGNIDKPKKLFCGRSATALCVGFSEIDRYATSIYKRHFPGHENFGDATAIDVSKLPDFDLLVGGFPCQTFSIAGKREGFLDTRGTLFFEIARVLEHCRPRHFLLENVPGLFSHESGQTFIRIIRILTNLGYRVEWQVLNSKDYGVPQNRERIFIAGCIRERGRPKVFPLENGNKKTDENGQVEKGQQTAWALRRRDYKDGTNFIVQKWQGWRQDGKPLNVYKDIAPTLRTNEGDTKPLVVTGPEQIGNIDEKGHNSIWGRVYDSKGTAVSINSEGGGLGAKTGLYELPEGVRRLTPIECERLQGFPDGWTERGAKGEKISDAQRYKCLGNAITVNVIEKIMEKGEFT